MIQNTLKQALTLHQGQNPKDAQVLYEKILKKQKNNIDALYLLGVLHTDQGQPDKGAAYLKQAIKYHPFKAALFFALGNALTQQKKYQEAIRNYNLAIQIKPDYFDAYINLGNCYFFQGQYQEALDCFKKSIGQTGVDQATTYNNIGRTYLALGDTEQADKHYWIALKHNHQHARTNINIAESLIKQYKFNESIDYLTRAIQSDPKEHRAYYLLGVVHYQCARNKEAVIAYHQAIKLAPQEIQYYRALADVFFEGLKIKEAEIILKKALSMDPNNAELLYSLAIALYKQDKIEEAIHNLMQSLEKNYLPRTLITLSAVIPCIYESVEEIKKRRAVLEKNIAALAQETWSFKDPNNVLTISLTFRFAYLGYNDKIINQHMGQIFKSCGITAPQAIKPIDFNKKPKIGFISSFFKTHHTIGKLNLNTILNIPSDCFEVHVISFKNDQTLCDFIEQKSNGKIKIHVLTERSFKHNLDIIGNLELDILFYTDIGMDRGTYLLAQSRLAKIQCTSWGHPVTSGIQNIDYFVSSQMLETEQAQDHYSESLVRLNRLPCFYVPPLLNEDPKDRTTYGFNNEDTIYMCPQSLFKLHPDMGDIFSDILTRDNRAKIVLINVFSNALTDIVKRNYQKRLGHNFNRVVFLNGMINEQFLNLIRCADVLLDTRHFGGGNTTYEALSLDIPIITWPSEYMRGRVTYGCYKQMGMMDCVAYSHEEYVTKAIEIANNKDLRKAISQKINKHKHEIFSDKEAITELTAFFKQAIQQYQPKEEL